MIKIVLCVSIVVEVGLSERIIAYAGLAGVGVLGIRDTNHERVG